MTEITFLVQEAEEGGYTARALGKSIFTEGETMSELKLNIKEAILCFFGEENYDVNYRCRTEILS